MFSFSKKTGLGFLLNDVARLLRQRFDAESASSGMTLASCRLMGQIYRTPGRQPAELALDLELSAVVVLRLIERLERRGMVVRVPDPNDRRAKLVHLTDAADPLIDGLFAAADRTWEHVMAAVSPQDVLELQRILEQLRHSLSPTAVKS